MRQSSLAFGLSIMAALAHLSYYGPQLPDVVASHFDLRGHADGTSSRFALCATYAGTVLLLGGLFAGLPPLLRRLPQCLINIPHRAFWLAPERIGESLQRLGDSLRWFGVATLAFLAGTMHLVFRANLAEDRQLGNTFAVLLVAYLLATAAWVARLLVQFRLPAGADPGPRGSPRSR